MAPTPPVTRFAPSPTGALHIGGARTALFNWLYARGHGGTFLLRIEDTDKARSDPQNTQIILDGLTWLGLDWDGEPTSQAANADRHAAVARQMLDDGTAYKCFSTTEEIEAFRAAARENKTTTLFQSPWRDVPDDQHPDAAYVVRVKAPRDGNTTLHDTVQGDVTWSNDQIDDMILLRSDGSPVYMLAVVVDDHDMGVTHVIRGDDHLANSFRQNLIYDAMGWDKPTLAHIPLIFGHDGKKLSKRHGATAAADYQKMGFPAAGMRNYLARLGWSHGDDEFFTDEQAKDWFDLDGIGKSPARFDLKKLEHISGQHIAVMDDAELVAEIQAYLDATGALPLTEGQADGLLRAMPHLKERSKTFPELLDKAYFVLTEGPISPDEKSAKALDATAQQYLSELTPHLQNVRWDRNTLEEAIADFATARDTKLGKLAGPLRAALAGRSVSPSVFDMMMVLGRETSLARIRAASV
ncbi:glutamate--tRNA ligase [Loktanella sp. SALINAS62]|uniref:glutamate--tRNA ligase n=1 Tax=Loktanella sp. SALINAS62 TaxID=2706124 RepID=UPI001B8C95CC|nr:glutamate--tRNA ligase [Loktanella sp. SALINAS62]MBS1301659.1 glutamate--tRNA ligase [Loktanella sp. SALINAS62]